MIKIIKQPTKMYQEKAVQKHFRCRYCGTEWIADPADYETRKAEVWINNVEQYNYLTIIIIFGQCHRFEYSYKGRTWYDVKYNQNYMKTFY